MIYTSNFFQQPNDPRHISIAARAPDFFLGDVFSVLYPKWGFFQQYKKDHDTLAYTRAYYEQVLSKLNPEEVFSILDKLPKDSILVCWEAPGEFCHRRIVAKWLEDNLDIKVPEYDYQMAPEKTGNNQTSITPEIL